MFSMVVSLFQRCFQSFRLLLSAILDCSRHITVQTRSCLYHLRQLRVVSRFLSASSTATSVHGFIVNRLEHCSSLYCGLPQVRLQPLDGLLRAAARMIGGVELVYSALSFGLGCVTALYKSSYYYYYYLFPSLNI